MEFEKLPIKSKQLPEGWMWVKLKNLLQQQQHKIRLEKNIIYTRLGVRWYAEGPFIKEAVKGSEIKGKDLYKVSVNEFIFSRLFAWKGSFGFISSFEDGMYVSNEFPSFKVDLTQIEPEFLWRLFSQPHIWQFIEERSLGSTKISRLRFKEADLLALEIPLPPLLEQQAIATALRTIRHARQTTVQELEAAKELKRSLMRHLFTYGAVSVQDAAAVELQETEIGKMPKDWKVKKVDELFESQLGKMLSDKARNGLSPKLYLRNTNIQWGKIETHDVYEMNFDEREQKKFQLNVGDALVCEGGDIGRTAIWNGELEECYFQKALHRVRARSENTTTLFFLHHMMNAFRYNKLYGDIAVKTTIAHLPGDKLKNLLFPLPPREEQNKITKLLQGIDSKISSLESRVSALDSLFQSALHSLMTGRKRLVSTEVQA